jgi:FMN phosphatase YigB (HAD superfamily)
MYKIKGSKFVYFDVDDTLVDWNRRDTETSLAFTDLDGCTWCLEPKWEIIRALKRHKLAGDTVIVWSQGGWDWAKEVVDVLQIEESVDAVITKPHIYYDDLHCDKFMGRWVKV